MLSLSNPPQKLFRWFRRPQVWSAGDCQPHHDNTPAHASHCIQSLLVKHQITQVTQSPLQTRFSALWLLAFPKTKITSEREEISDCWWDSGKHNRAAHGDGENWVRSHHAYFEEDWGITVLCTMFLASCIFFSKCLYFSYYMAVNFLDRLYMQIPIVSHNLVGTASYTVFWGRFNRKGVRP